MSMLIEKNMPQTMEEPTEIEEEEMMPTTMEYITPTMIEQLTAALEKLTMTMEEKKKPSFHGLTTESSRASPINQQKFCDALPKGKVWQKFGKMYHPKNNPKLRNSECLIYGLHKLADNATRSGEEARTYGEFFPEGTHIDDQGISGESILEKAAEGNFDQVKKLMELHCNTPIEEFPIERIMATLWYSTTCKPLERKLIHWVAYYNQLEVLEWMLDSSMILSSTVEQSEESFEEDDHQVEEYERQVEDNEGKFNCSTVGQSKENFEEDDHQVEEYERQVEDNEGKFNCSTVGQSKENSEEDDHHVEEYERQVGDNDGKFNCLTVGQLEENSEEDDHQVEEYERQVEDNDGKFNDKCRFFTTNGVRLPIKAKDSLNAQDLCGFTPMHLATMGNHEDIVKRLFAHDNKELLDIYIVAENMLADVGRKRDSNRMTILHCAARNESSLPIVKLLLKRHQHNSEHRYSSNFKPMIEAKSSSRKTALHYAAKFGNWEVVKLLLEVIYMSGKSEYVNIRDVYRCTPLHLAVSNSHVEVVEIILRDANGLNMGIVTWEGITALDIAKRNESKHDGKEKVNQRIVDMLESYDVNWMLSEREKYSAAASFLLVGAALIAGVTYTSWLQPPLGLTQNYDFPSSGPPGTYDSYVGVEEHWEIQIFWVFNAIAFFCSIVTFIIGAEASIPRKCASLREEVVDLRKSVVKASFILAVAILFAIGAFSSAGIIVLPPIAGQRAPTYVIIAIGAIICIKVLTRFIMKLWKWFHSPSLQFTMEKRDPNSKEFKYDGGWILKSRNEMPLPVARLFKSTFVRH